MILWFAIIYVICAVIVGFVFGRATAPKRSPEEPIRHIQDLLDDLQSEQQLRDDLHVDGSINDDTYEDESDENQVVKEYCHRRIREHEAGEQLRKEFKKWDQENQKK